MPVRGAVGHDENVIGAAVLLIADRVQDVVELQAGTKGASAVALTALLGWADGTHIDALAAGLRLSHSRVVRVVDGLERDGFAARHRDESDGRRALIRLTTSGRSAAERVLAARATGLRSALGTLSEPQLRAFAQVAEAILREAADSRAQARTMCRLCDVTSCGHSTGSCPTTQGADTREPSA
jgi:DNA-binding MarR family transcriptional regulator